MPQPLKLDTEPPEQRQMEPRPTETSRFVEARQEDSYEAALRAADALFSGATRKPEAKPEPAPWHAAPPLDAPARTDDQPDSPPPPRPGGRVLRVLDEPPPPELVQLEAEHAPKRRGRKPGSKNKPKTPMVVVEGLTPASAAYSAPSPAPVSSPSSSWTAAEPSMPVAASVTAIQPRIVKRTVRRAIASPAAAPEAHRDEKYAWVRTKLKPGERWKRRLPKVAW